MLRRSLIVGIVVFILLSTIITVTAALVREQPTAQSASTSIHEAGHVLAVTQPTRVFNENGTSKTPLCGGGVSFDSVSLDPHEDVVVVSGSDIPIMIPGEDGYFYKVDFPDPCQVGYDFSSTAIGYVLASNLVETDAVQIDPQALSRGELSGKIVGNLISALRGLLRVDNSK